MDNSNKKGLAGLDKQLGHMMESIKTTEQMFAELGLEPSKRFMELSRELGDVVDAFTGRTPTQYGITLEDLRNLRAGVRYGSNELMVVNKLMSNYEAYVAHLDRHRLLMEPYTHEFKSCALRCRQENNGVLFLLLEEPLPPFFNKSNYINHERLEKAAQNVFHANLNWKDVFGGQPTLEEIRDELSYYGMAIITWFAKYRPAPGARIDTALKNMQKDLGIVKSLMFLEYEQYNNVSNTYTIFYDPLLKFVANKEARSIGIYGGCSRKAECLFGTKFGTGDDEDDSIMEFITKFDELMYTRSSSWSRVRPAHEISLIHTLLAKGLGIFYPIEFLEDMRKEVMDKKNAKPKKDLAAAVAKFNPD